MANAEVTKRKIHSKDEFELCYLRHQYVKRCTYVPTAAEMEPYMKIATKFINNTFFTYMPLFRSVSFNRDDITNVARVHVVSFLSLFSLERNPEKLEEFKKTIQVHKFRDADLEDIEDKNHANFTIFLKQRMQDLVRVCRQKSRNVRGKLLEEYACYVGDVTPPVNPNTFSHEYEALGYKKIDNSVFKSARRKSDADGDATLFRFEKQWYVALTTDHAPLSYDEITVSGFDYKENDHCKRPDEMMEDVENTNLVNTFHDQPKFKKIRALRDFIAKYENRAYYEKEIKTAKSMLKKLGAKECAV